MEELTALSEDPDLWSDSKRARQVMREKSGLERTIGEWEALQQEVTDNRELFLLAGEEGDEEVLVEVRGLAASMLERVEALELQRMLSGENDPNNAFFEIHPGAGGTESQESAPDGVRDLVIDETLSRDGHRTRRPIEPPFDYRAGR